MKAYIIAFLLTTGLVLGQEVPVTEMEAPVMQESLSVLTLEEAVSRALEQNPDLDSSRSAGEAAKYRVDAANTVYSPTLNFSANYNHSASERGSNSVVSGNQVFLNNAGGTGDIVRDSLSTSLNARLPIYDATREPSVRSAKESLTAAEYEVERTAQELILQIRTLYYQTLLDQDLLQIQRQRVENTQQRLDQANGFYEAGTAARNEVTQAEADLAGAQLEVARAEAALELDWVNLNVLMGMPSQAEYQLQDEPTLELPPMSVEEFMKLALDERPELQSGWARVRAQIARVDAAVASRWPTLSASAGLNFNGQPSPLQRTWSAGLVLSWAVFDGGLTRAQTNEAKASAEQLTKEVESTGNQVYQEIASAVTGWRTAQVQYITAQAGVNAAEQNRFLAAERYRVGVGNSLELSDAEFSLVQARIELARAVNSARTAAAQLARAVGVVDISQISTEDIS